MILIGAVAVIGIGVAVYRLRGPAYDSDLVLVIRLPGTEGKVNVPKVARRGDTLYLCDDNLGLSLWDVSTPEKPALLTQTPYRYYNIYKMEIEGDYLLIHAERGPGPSVFDIKTPRSPRVVSERAGFHDSAVVGGFVYHLGDSQGVTLYIQTPSGENVDVELPDSPKQQFKNLAVLGDRYLIAVERKSERQPENLVVWDVSQPKIPRKIYGGAVEGMLDDIVVLGDIAYIAAPDLGVLVYDFSRPSAPVKVARLSGMTAFNVYVDPESRQLLVQSNNKAVYVLDVTDPRAPRPRARYFTSAAGIAAAPKGYLVVGNFEGVEMLRLEPRR